nr:hypothetical protein [uncultured Carboxylicivirga sp.]
MRQSVQIIMILILGLKLNAQDYRFRDNIDKDSLFNVSIERLPKEMQKEFKKMYKKGKEQEKEFLLFMISMPESSKKELIENFEKYKAEILIVKSEYSKLVPENYFVYIEFEPESKILTTPEQITIKIYKTKGDTVSADNNVVQRNDKLEVVSQNWNLKPDSQELEEIITSIGWTKKTLTQIKELLDRANCISIENGEITTIGFARSGMGKYSYKIFDNQLTENQKQRYDNGCEYIFYKENIVLEYGGGAIGPQCFEED